MRLHEAGDEQEGRVGAFLLRLQKTRGEAGLLDVLEVALPGPAHGVGVEPGDVILVRPRQVPLADVGRAVAVVGEPLAETRAAGMQAPVVAGRSVLGRHAAGHPRAAGRRADRARAVGAVEGETPGEEPINVGRRYVGATRRPDHVDAELVAEDDQHVGMGHAIGEPRRGRGRCRGWNRRDARRRPHAGKTRECRGGGVLASVASGQARGGRSGGFAGHRVVSVRT